MTPRRIHQRHRFPGIALAVTTSLALASAAPALSLPPPPAAVSIPTREVVVTDFDAVADGSTMCTESIQAAIDKTLASGGGRVVIPAGRFLCGPLTLGSKLDLHLAENAALVMSDDPADFPVTGNNHADFLRAHKCEDVRISGNGTIDGQGARWWKAFLELKRSGREKSAPRRPQMISIEGCRRVAVDSITTLNPPNTHFSIKSCSDVTIRGLHAEAPDDSPNTDALNLNRVRDALVRDCEISTGDDNIVLLCGEGKPGRPEVKNVVIRDCKLGFGHGLSIGSYTGGGVRNVFVGNVAFDGTTSGIRMKAWRDRGGVVEHIHYRNIRMKHVRYPVFLSSYYPKEPAHPSKDLPKRGLKMTPVWRDIEIRDVEISDSRNSIIVWGLPDEPIRNVRFDKVTVSADVGARVYHADGVSFENVAIHPADGPALRVHDATVRGLKGERETGKTVKFQ
ncbi:MAG: glycoside hydrolase family 28 protein [Verrucomicrobiae bacterium]|nr:glycoside hydrolase family 28 protein [Verrucomicrobiae bacterium]